MHLTAYFLSSEQVLTLASNAKTQALKFAICLGVGVAFGVFLLLLFRKSGKAERFVTDLFATLAAGMGYIGCLELVFGGKFELYGLIAYCAGACLIPSLFLLCKRRRTKRITPAN